MSLILFLAGGLVGIGGSLVSGALGVTSGGVLVPFIMLLFDVDQHAAQGMSLIAQVFPTSIAGVRRYVAAGHTVSLAAVLWIAPGFAVGGALGAVLAGHIEDRALRWAFVTYLVALGVLTALRGGGSRREQSADAVVTEPLRPVRLLSVGVAGGVSSGLLGIGGGLATTALAVTMLHLSQHRAQALSLVVTALPLTAPAALAYVIQGWRPPIDALVGIVAGLWIGTAMGARVANRLEGAVLQRLLLFLIGGMVLFMSWKAMIGR